MKKPPRIFVDSDVVISSLISKTGSAYYFVNESGFNLFISNVSEKELQKGKVKLGLSETDLTNILQRKVRKVILTKTIPEIKEEHSSYVNDLNDAHIVAGAVKAKAKVLLTFNIKHFDTELIKKELGILVLKPGNYLQYLRSQNN